jgi:hypothetical protein
MQTLHRTPEHDPLLGRPGLIVGALRNIERVVETGQPKVPAGASAADMFNPHGQSEQDLRRHEASQRVAAAATLGEATSPIDIARAAIDAIPVTTYPDFQAPDIRTINLN